jgi:O-antigen/teichoic acid export membrane protein
MKYFIIFTLLAFLIVIAYIDVLKHIIGKDYWEGLRVVPIVMAAEIMMGIYFNLSFWYKVIDKTIWGAIFSGIGCAVLLAVNFIFVPRYGYMACAWGGFAGYGVAMITSYIVGQKYYPINYPLKSIAFYTLLALIGYILMDYIHNNYNQWVSLGFNTLVVIIFLCVVIRIDFPLSSLPIIGKKFKK